MKIISRDIHVLKVPMLITDYHPEDVGKIVAISMAISRMYAALITLREPCAKYRAMYPWSEQTLQALDILMVLFPSH